MQENAIDQAVAGSSSVFIVEDEPEILEALSDFLESLGFPTQSFSNAEDALEAFEKEPASLVISDMKLPGMDGIELCKLLKTRHPETNVVVITAFGNISSALEAIDFGAEDYILKPFNLDTLRYSLQRIFEKQQLLVENRRYREQLEAEVRSRTSEVHQASRKIGAVFYKIVHVLGNSQECREPYLRGRTERVTIMSLRTAEKLGWGQDRVQELLLAAPISDVGKLAISETILNKPNQLTQEELEIVHDHVLAGERIINSLAHFKRVAPVIRLHHERHNGAGYPNGLRGHEIPDTASLVAIVDSFDAMTHSRPWRKAKKYDEALAEIRKLSGTEYNPRLVEAFIAAAGEHNFASLINTKPTKEFYELTLPLLEHIEYLYEDHITNS